MRIEDSEISIVLQGPIYKDITSCVCKRMREIFPNAEIIVSTWEGSDTSGLIYDILLENKDPGGTPLMLDGELNNKTKYNLRKERVEQEVFKHCLGDGSKVKGEFNYEAKTNLLDGLKEIIDYQQNHDKPLKGKFE